MCVFTSEVFTLLLAVAAKAKLVSELEVSSLAAVQNRYTCSMFTFQPCF